MWRSPVAFLLCSMTSEWPCCTSSVVGLMQRILPDVAYVSSTVLDQLNAMSGFFEVGTFIADKDLIEDASVSLHERLDALVAAVMTISSITGLPR